MKKITIPKKPIKTTKSITKRIEQQLQELARQQEYFNQFQMTDKGGAKF
jgi:hypothetical protein